MFKENLPLYLIDPIIQQALAEDLPSGDLSLAALPDPGALASVELLAKAEGRLCGLSIFARVFQLLDANCQFNFKKMDGDPVSPGDKIAFLTGRLDALLCGERTALNFLQRLSGIAGYTACFIEAMGSTKTRLVDTRKTTPGLRLLEKYAVRTGGAQNHRFNLSTGVMLKDNHIAAAGSLTAAVTRARKTVPFVHRIEVEVETMEMVKEAVQAGADIIMLDNMSPSEIRAAINYIDGRALVELSGNITLENIAAYAQIGADFISSGAITYGAPLLDLSMKNMKLH